MGLKALQKEKAMQGSSYAKSNEIDGGGLRFASPKDEGQSHDEKYGDVLKVVSPAGRRLYNQFRLVASRGVAEKSGVFLMGERSVFGALKPLN